MENEYTNRIIKKFDLFYNRIMSNCRQIYTLEDKQIYLKTIIKDCDKIIALYELFDDDDISVEFMQQVLQNIDENFFWLLDDNKNGPDENNNTCIKEKEEFYIVAKLTDQNKNSIAKSIEGIKNIKTIFLDESISISKSTEQSSPMHDETIDKLKIKSRMTDIVRIFEAMKKAGIISSKTTVKQIAGLFFTEIRDILYFEKNYNALKSRIKQNESSSNSEELVNFVIILCRESFSRKEHEKARIMYHLEHLEKNII